MGGRGTFAANNPVAYTYEVDTSFPGGKFEGVKVLKGIPDFGKHQLPESSHSSTAYLKMNPDGTFNMIRVYDKNHRLRLEIAYHPEGKLAKGKGSVLHYHVYSPEFSQTKNGKFTRTTEKIHKNSKLYKQFKKYFKGVVI